ncbi:GNAT family N-acetyltransferase [Bifidobacterium cuniculi]|uniref:Acetytransferase n=1 Tax=Bifidobacterium cuniculi TaxID=1688 RepID=A0A087AYA0_9BIFI|nr:GNAT family protein [Bifidobacterium cuniculi]KFI63750.1 acetytransferase [Bifidobacterium cuniculi]
MSVLQSLRDALRGAGTDAFPSSMRLAAPAGAPPLVLRSMRTGDEFEWDQVRSRNAVWLDPWESNDPMRRSLVTFRQWIGMQRRDERLGNSLVLLMELDGRIVGQISLGAVFRGAMRSGIVGYWVDQGHAGQGLTPLAVAMLADWALHDPHGPRLHRLEIDILPENQRSRRVVEKLGARYEGVRREYMYIHGRWRDHESYSLLPDDTPKGFVCRFLSDTPSETVHELS